MDVLVEMQYWVTDNIKAEHDRVLHIVHMWERAHGIRGERG